MRVGGSCGRQAERVPIGSDPNLFRLLLREDQRRAQLLASLQKVEHPVVKTPRFGK